MTNDERKKLMSQGYSIGQMMELERKESKSNDDLYSIFKDSKEKREKDNFDQLMNAMRRKS